MGSFKRAEKRREVKSIKKELEYIRKHTEFSKIMQSKVLQDLPASDIELLKKKEHPNAVIQARYDEGMLLLKRVLTLESRLLVLLGDSKENIPDVKQE